MSIFVVLIYIYKMKEIWLEKFASDLRKETGLWITEGIHYGKSGEGFIRMNIACPRATLEDGVNRLIKGVKSYR